MEALQAISLVTSISIKMLFIIALGFVIVILYKVVIEVKVKMEKRFDKDSCNNEDETILTQQLQKIMFFAFDAVHNLNDHLSHNQPKDSLINDEVYYASIRSVCVSLRYLASALSDSSVPIENERYKGIVKFLREDFHDFSHHLRSDIDTEKFSELVRAPYSLL